MRTHTPRRATRSVLPAAALAWTLLAPGLALAAPQAVATFESVGLSWSPAGGSVARECAVQYRPSGGGTWRTGLPLWFDTRTAEYRGSLVGLTPGTRYEVALTLAGGSSESVTVSTWSEAFPIARTVTLPGFSDQTLSITESGSPTGYILYTAAAGGSTIDVADAREFCVRVSASHVIVRGLTLRGAQRDAIRLDPGAHDVVIEHSDISGWGRSRGVTSSVGGYTLGVDRDAAVAAECQRTPGSLKRIIIQRNRIHDPRYGANSWDEGHPAGANGILFDQCGGNHVFRYNAITGAPGHYYNDGIGGAANFSTVGFPNADTDIYGNIISHCWDDAIEAEGGNRNVRIFGNYLDQTATGVATTVTAVGPVYIFRNVYNRARTSEGSSPDSDHRLGFAKSGSSSSHGDGRRYIFHNTLLQASQGGASKGLGAGYAAAGTGEGNINNTVTRNNIFHLWTNTSVFWLAGAGNDFGHDLFNGSSDGLPETNGIHGTPTYAAGNGWQSEAGGMYQLASSSLGHDSGARIPNFNDAYLGAAPDIGAHEAGASAMEFGVDAHLGSGPAVDPPTEPGDPPQETAPVVLPLALNAGGAAVAPFAADALFAGGTAFTNWTGAVDSGGVERPAPQAVYQSERYGDMTYTLDGLEPGAGYALRLHFCENYEPAAQLRRFDVTVNGEVVLADFSVLAAAGALHTAHVEAFSVVADTSGRLRIALTSLADSALLNGLELEERTAASEEPSDPPDETSDLPDERSDLPDETSDPSVEPADPSGEPETAECEAPALSCDGRCVDVTSDLEHCGTCGNACTPLRESCAAGACVALDRSVEVTATISCSSVGGAARDPLAWLALVALGLGRRRR